MTSGDGLKELFSHRIKLVKGGKLAQTQKELLTPTGIFVARQVKNIMWVMLTASVHKGRISQIIKDS